MTILNNLMMTASGAGSQCPEIEGTLWTWVHNFEGQLGVGDNTNYSVPTQVGSGTNWTNSGGVWSGDTLHMIKDDGTLWGWGMNTTYGNVGDGTKTNRNAPVQIGSDTDWAMVSSGSRTTGAVKTNGTLWTWGYNSYGRLGHGDSTARCVPTQVGSLTDWASVSLPSPNAYYMAFMKTDGTLWAAGGSGYGALGDGTVLARSSPVQIGSATNWIAFEAGGTDNAGRMRAIASV
jgi:alpha-tubulin suppressor-like RCC1 family protein